MAQQSIFTLLCSAAAHGLLVALVLFFSKRGNRRANFYLGALFSLVSLSIVLHALLDAGVMGELPHLHLVYASFGFLFGPLLYFHLGALTDPSGNWSLEDLLKRHAFPFFALVAYQLPFFLYSGPEKAAVLARGYIYFPGDQKAYDLLQNLSVLAYVIAAGVKISRFYHARNEKDLAHIAVFRWSIVAVGYVALTVVLALIQSASGGIFQSWIIPLTCAGLFGITAYFWFLFPEIFISILKPSAKYIKSGLRDEDTEKFESKLLAAMERERLYLDPDLSLQALSEKLNINQVYLSQIINERLGKTFFDLINAYRIQSAVRALETAGQEKTILDIAYESGFNSKSTFYTAFKKEMGMTPGEFLKKRAARSTISTPLA